MRLTLCFGAFQESALGLLEPVTGLANTNTQAGFQPVMIPACEVKTIGFQPQNALGPINRTIVFTV
jgi:hypothetical protein